MSKRAIMLQVCLLCISLTVFAQALKFSSSRYVNITNHSSLRLQNFTVEAWIKIEGTGIATGTVVNSEKGGGFKSGTVVPIITKGRREKGAGTVAINYFFGYRLSDRKLVGDFEDNGPGDHHTVVGNAVLPLNVWTHVAATYSTTGTWKLYINGNLDKTQAVGSHLPQSASNVTAAIASALNSAGAAEGYFNGSMDEVRIWNIARSEADITNNYKLQLVSGTGLTARYSFNEGSGTTAANSISSASNGRLINSPQWTTGYFQQPTPPTATITSPANNATFASPANITISATATDADGTISKVEYYNGAALIGTKTASPYTITWSNVGAGTYSLTVKATDNDGLATTSAAVNITVSATSANQPPASPTNPSPANAATVSGSMVSLCARATDVDNTQVRVRFYGRKKASGRKFSMIVLPDTQYYTSERFNGTNAMFKSQTSWIANNMATRNIVYVNQLGDCVDHGDSLEVEWKRADTAIKTIEDPVRTGLMDGIPYGICVGNHDQSPNGDVNGTSIYFNKYFGSLRFGGRSYYGGHMGTKNNNHYQLFSASGIDFLAISLEWNTTSGFRAVGGALDWAEDLVKNFPNRKVMVFSHYVINGTVGTDSKYTFSTQGSAIYTRLKVYPNFILMLGGHRMDKTGELFRTDTYNGTTVHTTMQDFQGRTNGGNGLLRIYEFDPQANKIAIQTYSPYTNAFETDANSQFTLDMNIAPATDTYALIGEVNNVTSGTNACVNWPSLQLNTDYEWYAEVDDGQYTTKGPVWSFLTRPAASATTAKTSFGGGGEVENVNQHTLSKLFDLYPNPNATGQLTIQLKNVIRGEAAISIINTSGQMSYKKAFKNPGKNITIGHTLPAGIYTVVVKTENDIDSKKLVVER